MTLSDALADLVLMARGAEHFRSTFGTVTSMSGADVYVRMDSMESGAVGPIPVVTGKLKVGDRALVTYLPDNKVWVAWGSGGSGWVQFTWGGRFGGSGTTHVKYARRVDGVWGTPVEGTYLPTGKLITGWIPVARETDDGDAASIPNIIAPPVGGGNTNMNTTGGGFIGRMSDGRMMFVSDDWVADYPTPMAHNNNLFAWTRDENSANWALASGPLADDRNVDDWGTYMAWDRHGDTVVYLFECDDFGANVPGLLLIKVVYDQGTVTHSSVVLSTTPYDTAVGVYIDRTNNLIHALSWVYQATTVTLAAYSFDTLALVYSQALAIDAVAGWDVAAYNNRLVGTANPADNTFLWVRVETGNRNVLVNRIVAGPMSYTVTVESCPAMPAAPPGYNTLNPGVDAIFDGEGVAIVVADVIELVASPYTWSSESAHRAMSRAANGSYDSAWTTVAPMVADFGTGRGLTVSRDGSEVVKFVYIELGPQGDAKTHEWELP